MRTNIVLDDDLVAEAMRRTAIKTKRAIVDMPAEALEMAWGFPESKRVELVDTQRRETWYWGDKAREAVLVDGRVQTVSGAELR